MTGKTLYDRSKNLAVHWLMLGEARPEWGFTKPMLEVACGYALDEAGLRERTTKVRENVTCKQCFELANPKTDIKW